MVKLTYSLQNILMEIILCTSLVSFIESTAFPEVAKNLRWNLATKDQDFRAVVACVIINFILVTLRLPFGSALAIGLTYGLLFSNPLISEKFFLFGTVGLVIFQSLALIARVFVVSRTFQRGKFIDLAKADSNLVSRVFQNLDQAFFETAVYYIASVVFFYIAQMISKGSLGVNILALQGVKGYEFNMKLMIYDIVTVIITFVISIFATNAINKMEQIITLSHECPSMSVADLERYCNEHDFEEYVADKEKAE